MQVVTEPASGIVIQTENKIMTVELTTCIAIYIAMYGIAIVMYVQYYIQETFTEHIANIAATKH